MTGQSERHSLQHYLSLEYPFNVIADEQGGYVVVFPDLPGCMTQVETLEELPSMAREARDLWLESTYEMGIDIPLPSYPEEYSGKFNVRVPKSLHHSLAEGAQRNGVSLNQYVVALLSRNNALDQVEHIVQEIARGASSYKTRRIAETPET